MPQKLYSAAKLTPEECRALTGRLREQGRIQYPGQATGAPPPGPQRTVTEERAERAGMTVEAYLAKRREQLRVQQQRKGLVRHA